MNYAQRRSALIAMLVAAVVLLSAGAAAAVSGGQYSQDQQDCPQNGSAWNTPPNTVPPGCHDLKMNIESGDNGGSGWNDLSSKNTRYAEFGTDKTPQNNHNPRSRGL